MNDLHKINNIATYPSFTLLEGAKLTLQWIKDSLAKKQNNLNLAKKK
jgi:hypothetical protein